MAQTVVLAVGTAAADSDDIVVAAGETVTVAIYAAGGLSVDDPPCSVVIKTPGDPSPVFQLDQSRAAQALTSPGTYIVKRPGTVRSIGVIKET